MSVEQALVKIVEQDLFSDQLPLPSIPKIILEVEQLIHEPEASLQDIADCIQKDPALTARIIRFAHSAWLGQTSKTTSLVQALTRIGLMNVKSLVAAFTMEPMFTAKNPVVRQRLEQCWQESARLTAAVLLLEKNLEPAKKKKIEATQLLLIAMTSQIGALPLFHYAEQYESTFANPSLFNRVLPLLTPKINEKILTLWQFDPEHIQVAAKWQLNIETFEPSYLGLTQLAALLVGLHKVNYEAPLLTLYVQSGLLPSLTWWELEQTQLQYQQLLKAFSAVNA